MRYDTRNRTSLSLRPNQSTTSMRPVLGRGEKGQDGSNVLPTDEAIANAIDTPGSDTAASLSASSAEAIAGNRYVADMTSEEAVDLLFRRAGVGHRAEIDFTTKANGAAPTHLDTGQPVNSTASGGTGGSLPVISGGALVWNGQTNGGGNAVTYFQADCSDETDHLTQVGCDFVFPTGTNDGVALLCIALWDHTYVVAGTTTPHTRCHFTITPNADLTTAKWAFYVGDGITSSPTALFSVLGPQTFTPPASFWDGVTPQRVQVDVDERTGGVTLVLPGSQVFEVTKAQILAKVEILNPGGSATFPDIVNLGWKTAMIEHLANAPGANTRLPKFQRMWAA